MTLRHCPLLLTQAACYNPTRSLGAHRAAGLKLALPVGLRYKVVSGTARVFFPIE